MKITRAFDFLYHQKEQYPLTQCLSHKVNGQWKSYSTDEVIAIANRISHGLLAAGLQKGDKVAIISANRPEWNFIDLGAQQIGVTTVPMYPNITIEDYKYIFEHAEVKLVFVGDEDLFAKAAAATRELPVKEIYTFDAITEAPHWTEIEKMGTGKNDADLKPYKDAVHEDDLLTIIYTSGTTGRPKGVMLSHKNVVSNSIAVDGRLLVQKGSSRALSFLPLCHIYERTGTYLYMYAGVAIFYAESMEAIADNLKEIKPHVFNTVPRLLEKIFDKIIAKGNSLSGAMKTIFDWAIDLGLKFEPHMHQGMVYYLQLAIARMLVFSKWKEALGGNVTMITCGAAALQPRLARIFWAAGIKVCEGYGLTEASPVIAASMNEDKYMRVGCTGPALDGVTIKIAEDGEILAKGPNIMQGYYKNPEATAETIKDGWLHTGDIGVLVEGKYLKITDRKKEMFKTSGGKYIAPQMMENKYKESILIEQISIIGADRKFPSALIVPNFEALQEWCINQGVEFSSTDKVVKHPLVTSKFENEIKMYNMGFGHWEQVKKITILPQPWSVEGGELTATLKLKRRVIEEKYKKEIEEMYA